MTRSILFAFAFLMASAALVAQPNLGDVTIPTPTKSIDYQTASTVGVDPGPSGDGVEWDFTALVSLNNSVARRIVTPQQLSLELQERFPTATYAVVIDSITNVYEKQDATVRWLGSQTSSTQAMAGVADPYDVRPIEIVFNQPHVDAFKGTFTPLGAPGSFDRTGSINLVYDGFGTLRLPNNIRFENVARVLSNESSVDSLQAGPNLIEIRTNDNRAVYQSIISDTIYMMIVSRAITRFVNGLPEGETVREERVLYLDDGSSTSVDEEVIESTSTYPNPTSGSSITIEGTNFEPVSVDFVGIQGQTTQAMSFMMLGNNATWVQLPDLAPGIYQIQVRSDCSAGPCRRVDASVVIVR